MPNWLPITFLFIILSPGLFITIPAGSKGMIMSRQTSVNAILVHALVFIIIYQLYLNSCDVWERFEDASGVDISGSKVISAVPIRKYKSIKDKPITSLIENSKAANAKGTPSKTKAAPLE